SKASSDYSCWSARLGERGRPVGTTPAFGVGKEEDEGETERNERESGLRCLLPFRNLRECLLPCSFELIARYPGGHLVRVRDLKADTKAEVGVFDHAVEIPPRRNLVRRLVVVVLLVRLVLFPEIGRASCRERVEVSVV